MMISKNNFSIRRNKGFLIAIPVILVMALFFVQVVPAAPQLPIPSNILDPNSVGWTSVRNMTSAQFSDYFKAMSDKGYMVIDIEVDEIDGTQRVGAVWQRNIDGRGWFEYRNMTSSEFHDKWVELKDRGFRVIDQEAYSLGGKMLYAGVWIKNTEGLAWASFRNATSSEFSDLFNRYKDDGLMIIDVDAYPIGGEMRYSAVWVENSENLAWQEWRNMTSSEFSDKFQELKGEYRMIDVEGYIRDGKQNYAGIWIENKNNRGWYEYRDMTSKQFGDKWLQLRDAGYRVINYEVYPIANGWRYAGVWRQNSDRQNWELKSDVDALLQEHFDEFDIPGMSVAIAQNGQFLYLRGFGYADIDDDVIASSSTIYRLASISKAVGGAISMRLAADNQLDLDAPSSDYIPGLPAHHTHIVEETISNRSGIGHYEDYPSVVDDYGTALEAAMELWDDPLVYTPGSGYKYSTHAYTFLGASMEGAVNQSITQIVENQLTDPFNLNTLRVEDRDVPNSKRATLYSTSNDEVTPDDLSWKVLGGGLESSAYDLARFGNKLLNETIMSETWLNEMWTPPDGSNNYAMGWNTGTEDGTPVVAKSGAQNGARSYIRMYPEKGIVIVVLTNRKGGGHSPVTLGRDLGALMLDAESLLVNGLDPAFPVIEELELDEPDGEAMDPELIIYPVESPVVNPTVEDMQEPVEAPINQIQNFLPLIQE
jgi:CubicO group peptidase (beta-lactamase class C family)